MRWTINFLRIGITMEESCNRCHRNKPSPWRHDGRDSVSNHQPHDCSLKGLFRRRSKKTWKLRVTGLCGGNSPGTGEFPAQMASNAENVSIWWRDHVVQGYFRSNWWLHLDDGAHALARWRKPAPHPNTNMPSYQHRNPKVKDKTVLSLKCECLYPGKTVFILRQGPVSYFTNAFSITIPIRLIKISM